MSRFYELIFLVILLMAMSTNTSVLPPNDMIEHDMFIRVMDCGFNPNGCKIMCEKSTKCEDEVKMVKGFGCHGEDFCYCDLEKK